MWVPLRYGIAQYAQCPVVPYCRISVEAIGHPSISSILFYENWEFGHTPPLPYWIFCLLCCRVVGIFVLRLCDLSGYPWGIMTPVSSVVLLLLFTVPGPSIRTFAYVSFCLEFLCMFSLLLSGSPTGSAVSSTSQKHASGWTGYAKLSLSVRVLHPVFLE